MRILFDQGTPVQIGLSLSAHSVRTAREQGWSALANGELLRVAEEAGFDLFLTTDKNLRYQQNLSAKDRDRRAWQWTVANRKAHAGPSRSRDRSRSARQLYRSGNTYQRKRRQGIGN